jgi:hypothetical protein
MSNDNRNSQDKHLNPTDEFLTRDQDGEISRPESVQEEVFDVKADDLLHQPVSTSQEHSLDDTHETLTESCFGKNDLLAVAEAATKINSTS